MEGLFGEVGPVRRVGDVVEEEGCCDGLGDVAVEEEDAAALDLAARKEVSLRFKVPGRSRGPMLAVRELTSSSMSKMRGCEGVGWIRVESDAATVAGVGFVAIVNGKWSGCPQC